VENILSRLRVPLESIQVRCAVNTVCARQVIPEALVQACFMHDLTTPEVLGLASYSLAPSRDRIPSWKDAVECDMGTQLLFHKPTGGVEENTEQRAILLPLFYAARPRLGTPPALSRRAADMFVKFKVSPPEDTRLAMREVAAAVAFMPPLRVWYGLLGSDPDFLCMSLRFLAAEVEAGHTKKHTAGKMMKEVALETLEMVASEAMGALDDSNTLYLVALKRLERRAPSHASAVCFYLDSVVGRKSVEEAHDQELARLEAELLGRIAGRLDRFARERPNAARRAYDHLLVGIVAMFEEGDPRAVAAAARDRVPCLLVGLDAVGICDSEWEHNVSAEHVAADRALLETA
jgi:hypothetical protein